MTFRIRTTRLFLTYPRCDLSKQDTLTLLTNQLAPNNIEEYIIASEKHQDGANHLHVYLRLSDTLDTRDPNFADIANHHGNYQSVRCDKAIIKYCVKEDAYISNFDVQAKVTLRNSKQKLIFAKLIKGEIELPQAIEENPSLIKGYKKLKSDLQEYFLDKKGSLTTDDVRGVWIYGPPGVGKSHMAREIFTTGGTYIKPQNKWWDGYAGESNVIIDDLDTNMLNHHLKIWADRYACLGEVKGGTVPLQHRKLIITSNYPISHFCGDDEDLRLALERRFRVIHKTIAFNK